MLLKIFRIDWRIVCDSLPQPPDFKAKGGPKFKAKEPYFKANLAADSTLVLEGGQLCNQLKSLIHNPSLGHSSRFSSP
jgi:hypothetical protein